MTFRLDLDQPLELRGSRFEQAFSTPPTTSRAPHPPGICLNCAARLAAAEIIEPDLPEDLTAFAASLDQVPSPMKGWASTSPSAR